MNKKLLIFGCGYTAQAIGKNLSDNNWQVFGTTRLQENFNGLIGLGIIPVMWEDQSRIESIIKNGCSILISVAPKESMDIVLQRFLDVIMTYKSDINWLGYLSSTGVYGNKLGEWVFEDSVLNPTTDRGKVRVKVEKIWQKLAISIEVPLYIFRISGIYGPGRSAIDRIRNGKVQKIFKKDHYFNRIHLDDIVGIVISALFSPNLAGIYNLSDDLPSPGGDVIDEAARLLNLPILNEVNFQDADLTEMGQSFFLESKKVSNKKLKYALGYSFKHPTYLSGLLSILKNY